ncbi:SEC-C metal-binding domain-containing protein [Pedobacter yonginense]
MNPVNCPCGSGLHYSICCEPYHKKKVSSTHSRGFNAI